MHCTLGARQNLPRTPAQLAPGWEEMVARSHCQECQPLDKGRLCTEGALYGAWGGANQTLKAAKPNIEEECLSAQER